MLVFHFGRVGSSFFNYIKKTLFLVKTFLLNLNGNEKQPGAVIHPVAIY